MRRVAAVLAVVVAFALSQGAAFAAGDNAAKGGKGKAAAEGGKGKAAKPSKAGKAEKPAGKGKAAAPAKGAAAPGKPILLKAVQKSKGPVTFDHGKHGAVECAKCHHANGPGKEQGCFACHGVKADGRKVDAKEAFHKQCKGCHAEGKKGPTKCDECHKK